MNWQNKCASYLGLQGSGSDDLGLQGGSNINAVWSSELADVAICFDTCLFVYQLMKLFFNSETQSDCGGMHANYLQTDKKTKMH